MDRDFVKKQMDEAKLLSPDERAKKALEAAGKHARMTKAYEGRKDGPVPQNEERKK